MTTTLERSAAVSSQRSSPAVPPWLGPTVVLAAFAGSALVVPTLANIAVTDDWVYYRSVETLLVQHRVEVPQLSSAALVFQTLWGGLFASLFGLSFGTLRLSTLVMVGLGGMAAYAVMRELGVSRAWSAVGMAAYLFHPLSLSLGYTFMTDPHFLGLVLIATWLYVRGLRGSAWWWLGASVVASCAILVRQQGVLLPAGVFAALLLTDVDRSWRRSAIVLLQTSALPAATFVAYSLWLRYVNGTPYALSLFYDDFAAAGWTGVLELVPRLGIILAIYVGLFVLPIALAALRGIAELHLRGWRLWGALAWACGVIGGAVSYWLDGQKAMPYVGQFVTPTGIGPEDLIAARPLLMQPFERVALTIACVGASIVFAFVVARVGRVDRAMAVVVGVALGQVLGTLPPSVHFVSWGGTLDRYLLPLLPFSVVLLLAALRGVRSSLVVAWVAVVVMGIWSIAGTRDHLAFLVGVWSLASDANALGIDNSHLDAGAGWDGFHDYQAPPDPTVRPRTPHPPWWAELFAPGIDSTYVIAGDTLPGYAVVKQSGYYAWLRREWVPLYLLKRDAG